MQRGGVSRRAFAFGIGSVVAGPPAISPAQFWERWPDEALRPPSVWGPWRKIPSVVIISDENDARLPAVYDAIRFWNDMLLMLGSPFHFGPVTRIVEVIPHKELDRQRTLELPLRVSKVHGDVIVVLSDGPQSIAIAASRSERKTLVIIRQFRTYQTKPPTTLSGAQDTIAHELGHAIGLNHNNDPTSLMCRPCRYAEREGFSPLTEGEKELLLKMYPPSWREYPS